jgi:hypothetical protein
LTDAQYAKLVEADYTHWQTAPSAGSAGACMDRNIGITSPICAARKTAYDAARQKFQDDLERSRPSSRLMAMHAQLRQDLAVIEASDREMGRIIDTGDQAAFEDFYNSRRRRDALIKLDHDASQLILCAYADQDLFQAVCR